MVHKAQRLQFEVLDSELEALLIEAELIRIHQPPTNILLKDDKTPLYIHITDEEFPRVLTIRKKEIDAGRYSGTILGPYPSGYKVTEVLKIVRKIFPWCNQQRYKVVKKQACFYHHLDLCPGVCVGEIDAQTYQDTIKELVLFLKGKKKQVITDLKQSMKTYAETQQYEKAAKVRDTIQKIENVTKQTYRLKPDVMLPLLTDSIAEDGTLQLRKMLRDHFSLPRQYQLKRIEGYDVSNNQGTNAAVSMVTFIDGKPDKSEYKLFNIRGLNTPNDYYMLKEATVRRQNHPEWGRPDLVLIDGGKGQLRGVISEWTWDTPVISIAKDPDRLLFPQIVHKGQPVGYSQKQAQRAASSAHRDYSLTWHEIKLPPEHPVLRLMQQVRDESHRFSKKQHHRRQLRTLFE